MEQNNQVNLEFPMSYVPPTPIAYAYPPYSFDTMETSYVHSLLSTPYHCYIPYYAACNRNYCPHTRITYDDSQMWFTRVTTPNLGSGTPTSFVQDHHTSPITKNHYLDSMLLVNDPCEIQDDKSSNSSKLVQADNDEKSYDPRIINIFESLRQLYSEKEESLRNIFPSVSSKLSDFFTKVNSLISDSIKGNIDGSRPHTLKRSLSLGSATCKNDWFKVRPIGSEDVLIIPPEGNTSDDVKDATNCGG